MTDQQKLYNFIKYQDEHFAMTLESMAHMKVDLIWLYTHLEVKADESKRRGKEPSKEYVQSIKTIQRASNFISVYCAKLEQMESKLQEQARQLEYYRSVQPRVDFSKMRLHWNGKRIKYIKDFVKAEEDNF